MERKFLNPQIKEILIKDSADTKNFIEVFHYEPEGETGSPFHYHLALAAQLLSDDEALSYIPTLIYSYIKRELNSNTAEEDISKRFENSLKKTNELIFELSENNNIKLDITATLIKGDRILVSKIGKGKLFLAREGECVEVFNNVSLFEKKHFSEKEFSNIISGNLKPNDKFMLFIPNRRLSARENILKASLVKMNQSEFGSYIFDLAKNINQSATEGSKFTAAALHFFIKEELVPVTTETTPASEDIKEKVVSPSTEFNQLTGEIAQEAKQTPAYENQKNQNLSTVGLEISKESKENFLLTPFRKFWKWNTNLNKKMDVKSKIIGLSVITALVLGSLGASRIIISRKKEESIANAKIEEASDNFKIAQAKLLTGEIREARRNLYQTLNDLEPVKDNERTQALILEILGSVNKIDKVNESKPTLLADFSEKVAKPENIFIKEENIYLTKSIDEEEVNKQKIYLIKNAATTEVAKINTDAKSKFLFDDNINFYDGEAILSFNTTNDSKEEFSVKNASPAKEIIIYADNLYLIKNNDIRKASDVFTGQSSLKPWLTTGISENLISFMVEKSIFAISESGKLLRFYKGELLDEREFDFDISKDSKLFKLNNDFIVLDIEAKKARIIDNGGNLKTTYDLENTGELTDGYFSETTKTLYLLSEDKVWNLRIDI